MSKQVVWFAWNQSQKGYYTGGFGENAEYTSQSKEGAEPLTRAKNEEEVLEYLGTIVGNTDDDFLIEKVTFIHPMGEGSIQGSDVGHALSGR